MLKTREAMIIINIIRNNIHRTMIRKRLLTLTCLLAITSTGLITRSSVESVEIGSRQAFPPPIPLVTKDTTAGSVGLSESGWNGKLSFQFSRQFACTYHGGTQNDVGTISQTEELIQNLNMQVSADRIELLGGLIAKIEKLSYSGTIDIKFSFKREEERKEYYKLREDAANNTFSLSEESLAFTMIIQKIMSEDPEAMQKRLEELARTDPTKLAQEVEAMGKKGEKGDIPIEILITIAGAWPSNVSSTLVVNSRYNTQNETSTDERNVSVPMRVRLTGTMNIKPDGTGSIMADFSGPPEQTSNGMPESFGCPPFTNITTCHLTLTSQ